MIVSCGEALIDLVPEAVPGGGPMNVAIAAARLGAPSAFVGALSTDDFGEQIVEHLRSNSVDLTLCTRSDAPTALAIVEHEPVLRFRFEGDDTADTRLGPIDLTPLGDGPHILHGGTLGMFRGETAASIADLVRAQGQAGRIVSLDPNIRPQIIDDRDEWLHFHDRWLPHTTIYKASDEDLRWIWPDQTPESCAGRLLRGGVAAVIVTKGAEGLSIYSHAGRATAQAPQVDVVDTVGAGDTTVAAVLTQLWEDGVRNAPDVHSISRERWTAIGQSSAQAAAITCGRAGADTPYRREVSW